MGWALFEQGGLVMYPLALCSVLALGIAIERGFALRRRAIIRPEIVNVIDNIQGPEDIGLALNVCQQHKGPFSAVMHAGLENRHLSLEEIRESILDQGRQEMGVLQKGLVVLETVAGVSPLLGTFGHCSGHDKGFSTGFRSGRRTGQSPGRGHFRSDSNDRRRTFYCDSITRILQFIQQPCRKLDFGN